MNKSDKALELFSNNFNCSQAVLTAFAPDFGLDEQLALKFLNQFGYGKEFYENNIKPNFEFPIQPAKLQSFLLEYRSHELLKSKMDQKKK